MRFSQLSTGRQRVLLALVVLVLCALLVALAEGAVRLRQYLRSGTLWGVDQTYTLDAQTGLRIPVPGLVAGGIAINGLGFRGPEIAMPKPPGRIRIAYLGASTTYCAEVSSNAATWPALVHERLAQAFPDASFDYVNAGVPGYSVATSRENLTKRVARLEPDLIVVYHATNDLSGNSFDLARERGVVEARSEERRSWLSRHSLLAYLVEKNLQVLMRQSQAQSAVGKLETTARELALPFEHDLDALLEEASRVAPLVAIATFSYRMRREQSPEQQKDAAVTSLYYMPYLTLDSIIEGFEAYNETIRAAAARHGVLLIPGELEIPGDATHFKDSVHFTDAGSRAMARRVFDALSAAGAFRELVQARSGS